MWEIGEVAGGEDCGPSNVVSVRQCVEQLECILKKTTFAVRVYESFVEEVVLVETGFDDLCVEFLGEEWVVTCQGAELRFDCECIVRVRE